MRHRLSSVQPAQSRNDQPAKAIHNKGWTRRMGMPEKPREIIQRVVDNGRGDRSSRSPICARRFSRHLRVSPLIILKMCKQTVRRVGGSIRMPWEVSPCVEREATLQRHSLHCPKHTHYSPHVLPRRSHSSRNQPFYIICRRWCAVKCAYP